MRILIEKIPVVFFPLKGTAQRKMFVKRNIAFLRVTNTSGVFFMLPTNCLDTVVDGEKLKGKSSTIPSILQIKCRRSFSVISVF